jgi:large subunit ribosomal protein L4
MYMNDKKDTQKKTTKTATAGVLSAPVYNATGKEVRTIELPVELFGAKMNDALVHQVVVSMESNARNPIAHVKGRGDVRGGGKKPWKQKGTGRARHGSRRSPIWVGGGVTHGPTSDRNFSKKINKKMKDAALASVLSAKLADGEVLFVDMPEFKEPKTAEARKALTAFGTAPGFGLLKDRRNNAALIALDGRQENTEKSFRNMGNINVVETRNLNPVSLLAYRTLVIANPEASLETLTKRMK